MAAPRGGAGKAGVGVKRRAAAGFRAVPFQGSSPGGIGLLDTRGGEGRDGDRAGREEV